MNLKEADMNVLKEIDEKTYETRIGMIAGGVLYMSLTLNIFRCFGCETYKLSILGFICAVLVIIMLLNKHTVINYRYKHRGFIQSCSEAGILAFCFDKMFDILEIFHIENDSYGCYYIYLYILIALMPFFIWIVENLLDYNNNV